MAMRMQMCVLTNAACSVFSLLARARMICNVAAVAWTGRSLPPARSVTRVPPAAEPAVTHPDGQLRRVLAVLGVRVVRAGQVKRPRHGGGLVLVEFQL